MPVIAVASIYMGGAALAAGGLTAMGTIAAIGSIVGGIGALTGNKTLMKIGAVAGLAGGIGAFAQSKGWIASGEMGSALGDTAMSNTQAMANQSSSLVEQVAPTVDAGMSSAGSVTQGIGDAASTAGATAGLEGSAGALADGSLTQGLTEGITQANPLMEQGGGLMNAGAQEPVSSMAMPGMDAAKVVEAGVQPLSAADPGLNPTDFRLGQGTQTPPLGGLGGNPGGSGGGVMDMIGKFGGIFRNPDGTLNKDMVSMASNFIGGAFDEKKAADTAWAEAQTNALNQQMANASDVPGFIFRNKSRGPLFKKGQPTYRAPRIGGLMNAR